MQISTAIELKDLGRKNWGWILALGILGVIFSLLLRWNPLVAGLTAAFWTGMGLITLGAVSIVMAFNIKNVKDYIEDKKEEWEDRFDRD